MFFRSTVAPMAVAGLSALALVATATPALADADKVPGPSNGSLLSHGAAVELLNGAEQTLSGKKKYVYDQEFIYWSAVAVRSEGGKPSLSLFADQAGETLLTESKLKGKKTEFVVVDSNHATVPGTYYPRANSKDGDSTVELDNDAAILFDDDPLPIPMTESDVVIVTDVFLDLDVEYVLTVSGDGDAGLYLMQSDGALSSTWYQSRADAVAKSDKKDAGQTEKIKFTGTDDWYSLVLLNNSGGGTYTLTKTVA